MFKRLKERKELRTKLANLENIGMLDLMEHQFNRYKLVTHFTRYDAQWGSWIRR